MAYLRLLSEQGIALLGALVLVASGAQAATLNVVDGQLMGASGVIVDGTAYNVQFLDGACTELFNGCDDASDFIWQTRDAAILASQALLDQVFLDVPQGLFDDSPNLTNGCNSLHNCEVLSKFPVFITDHGVSVAHNVSNTNLPPNPPSWALEDHLDLCGPVQCLQGHASQGVQTNNTTNDDWSVFAVWTIPEPSTGLLFATGILGLALRRRSH